MIVDLYILTYAHGHQQTNVMLNSDEFLIMSLLILFFQTWNILETSLKGFNACSYYMFDNVDSRMLVMNTPIWSRAEHDLPQKPMICPMPLLKCVPPPGLP